MFVKVASVAIGTLSLALAQLSCAPASAGPVTFSAGGSDLPASIQATVDAFRAALGNPNNGNNPGPLAGGRREINWDGGGSDANAFGPTPFDVFLNSRGVRLATPGTGFIQAPASGGPDFGLAGFFGNASYGDDFGTFSPSRLFTPVGSNVADGLFFIPGTAGGTAATVSGFGAVFTDVDLPNTTKIQFFDQFDDLLAERFVPAGTVADQSLSFLGVIFDAGEEIARVRITTGTSALGPSDNPTSGVDLVVMDDFLYSEPQALQAVPEPASLALLGLGLAGLGIMRRRKA